MATFVHLTAESNARGIRRAGLRAHPTAPGLPDGVYALPTTPEFAVSHQWLRELKVGGQRTVVAVYFRLPGAERVYVGHYGGPHRETTAADAAALLFRLAREHAGRDGGGALGYEVIVPRAIRPAEVHRVRRPPQDVGWRHAPQARALNACPCPVCIPPGTINARRKRARLESDE
jgi:hypothetical protein